MKSPGQLLNNWLKIPISRLRDRLNSSPALKILTMIIRGNVLRLGSVVGWFVWIGLWVELFSHIRGAQYHSPYFTTLTSQLKSNTDRPAVVPATTQHNARYCILQIAAMTHAMQRYSVMYQRNLQNATTYVRPHNTMRAIVYCKSQL